MQFYKHPEISWTEWFSKACDTELGEFLHSKLESGTFIDVPCGLEDSSQKIIEIIQTFGICTYIEVDASAEVLGLRLKNPVRTTHGMTVHTHQADVLAYITGLDRSDEPKAIYISGLQPDKEFCKDPHNQSNIVVPYLQSLYKELERVCKAGDLVILNEASTLVSGLDEKTYAHIDPSIALLQHDFVLKRICPHGKVHVFESIAAL